MMHKTLLGSIAIAWLALACPAGLAAPFYSQNFDGANWPPTSWSVANTAGTLVSWYLNTYWGDVNYAGLGGNAAMISSTARPRLIYNCTLNSPILQLPATASGLELRFRTVLETWSGDETADVDITGDLVNWTNVFRWKNVDHLEGQQVINLMPYLGKYFRVRFRYYNTASQAWDLYWQIDDFRIVVPLTGDINKDDTVDVEDLLTFAASWSLTTGQTGFDPACDFNSDGSVDVDDLLTLAQDWGQSS